MGRIDVVCWVVVVVMLAVTAEGEVHKVGDELGWAIGGPNYNSWASSNVFHVGDTLLFEYMPGLHNVLEVSKQDYEDCNTESPVQTFSSGSDSIVIKKAGTFYYICGIPTHCTIGQKVEIRALSSNTSASPPPVATPPPSLPPPVSPAGEPPSVPPTGGPPPSLPPTVSPGPSDGPPPTLPPTVSPGPSGGPPPLLQPPVSPGPTMNDVAPPPRDSAAHCYIVDGGMGWLALVIATAIAVM